MADQGTPIAPCYTTCSSGKQVLGARGRPQQRERVDVDPAGDALDALQGEVAFAALNRAHVGAMYTYDISEGLLTESQAVAVGAQVAPEDAL